MEGPSDGHEGDMHVRPSADMVRNRHGNRSRYIKYFGFRSWRGHCPQRAFVVAVHKNTSKVLDNGNAVAGEPKR